MTLLVSLVAMLVARPLLVERSITIDLLGDLAFGAIYVYLFFITFARSADRRVAAAILVPVAASDLGQHLLSGPWGEWATAAFHCMVVVFLGFVVGVILRDLFSKPVIRGDDVIGAVCGYLIGALVWSHLLNLTYLFLPGAFTVTPAIARRLADPHVQRVLFDYLSFTTLTSLGFSEITPGGPPVYSLSWLEVLFGQFYMAVVVAQMVGLKLAQAIREADSAGRS